MIKSREFLDKDEVLYKLNVSPETLDRLVTDYFLLAVQQKTGNILYPSFQFKEQGINPAFSTIFQCFKKANADGWIILQWLFEENEIFEGSSPVEYSIENNSLAEVRMAASVFADTMKL